MPITQIPSNQVIPKKPQIAQFNGNLTANVYSTVVNTNNRGKLTKVTFTSDNTSLNYSNLQIRITIDGNQTVILPAVNNPAFEIFQDSTKGIDFFNDSSFTNNLTVEILVNASLSPSPTFYATVMYSIE